MIRRGNKAGSLFWSNDTQPKRLTLISQGKSGENNNAMIENIGKCDLYALKGMSV